MCKLQIYSGTQVAGMLSCLLIILAGVVASQIPPAQVKKSRPEAILSTIEFPQNPNLIGSGDELSIIALHSSSGRKGIARFHTQDGTFEWLTPADAVVTDSVVLPDDKTLFYLQHTNEGARVLKVDLNTGEHIELATTKWNLSGLASSASGRFLGFSISHFESGMWDLAVLDASSGKWTRTHPIGTWAYISQLTESEAVYTSWMPDESTAVSSWNWTSGETKQIWISSKGRSLYSVRARVDAGPAFLVATERVSWKDKVSVVTIDPETSGESVLYRAPKIDALTLACDSSALLVAEGDSPTSSPLRLTVVRLTGIQKPSSFESADFVLR